MNINEELVCLHFSISHSVQRQSANFILEVGRDEVCGGNVRI